MSLLPAALAILLLPAAALCAIYEYADADGFVKYYKYTARNGTVVFTDQFAAIPEELRKKNKIVRVGPSPRRAAPAPAATPAATPAAVEPGNPAAPEATDGASVGSDSGRMIGGIAVLLASVAGVVVIVNRRRASRSSRRSGSRGASASRPKPVASDVKDPPAVSAPDSEALPRKRYEMPQEALRRYLSAWDFVSAAKLCESLGRLYEAARYHLRAGNAVRARELYIHLADYKRAAELFEQAGDIRRAAELYEAQFVKQKEASQGLLGRDSALKSGRLFETIGVEDRALEVYKNARYFLEAAAIYEARGDLLDAAECFLQAEEFEKAAEYFVKAGHPARGHAVLSRFLYEKGRVKEAAEHAEMAGETVEAATMFQESGDPARAAGLFLEARCFTEAAENFVQAGEALRAAEAFELAGTFLGAARCLEGIEGDPRRIEALYWQSGNFFEVGRFLVKRGDSVRALSALQRVDAGTEHYEEASLLIGKLFFEQGETAQAIEKFTRVIGHRPVDRTTLEPYYFLALSHEAAGEGRSARSIFTKILAEDLNYRDARERVAGC